MVPVLSFTGVTAQKLTASSTDCADYACSSHEGCESVDCDLCWTRDRCALNAAQPLE